MTYAPGPPQTVERSSPVSGAQSVQPVQSNSNMGRLLEGAGEQAERQDAGQPCPTSTTARRASAGSTLPGSSAEGIKGNRIDGATGPHRTRPRRRLPRFLLSPT